MKWILLLAALAVLVVWLARGRGRDPRENPQAKTVSRQRYYVRPPDDNEVPPDDQHGDKL